MEINHVCWRDNSNSKKQKERHEKTHADIVVIVSVNPCLQTDKKKTGSEDLFHKVLHRNPKQKNVRQL